MRKLLVVLAALLVTLMFTPSGGWAAGTVTDGGAIPYGSKEYELVFTWVGDASDGSVPSTASSIAIDGYVYKITTNPDSPAPTDNYAITLTDKDGVDVLGGLGANRDTANSETIVPKAGTITWSTRINGTLTLNISSNTDVSATGIVRIYFYR